VRHRIRAAVAAALLHSSVSYAQAPAPPAPALRESFAVGAAGATGWVGRVAALRLSGPINDRFGVDVNIGRLHGRGRSDGPDGLSVGAHVRWLWHGRRANGSSGYWLFGPLFMRATQRTEIRWPNHVTTYLIDHKPIVTPQVGYGWDRLLKNGARGGVELTTGGGEEGPVAAFVHAFVAWGRRPSQ
jgi:hypothetical protein